MIDAELSNLVSINQSINQSIKSLNFSRTERDWVQCIRSKIKTSRICVISVRTGSSSGHVVHLRCRCRAAPCSRQLARRSPIGSLSVHTSYTLLVRWFHGDCRAVRCTAPPLIEFRADHDATCIVDDCRRVRPAHKLPRADDSAANTGVCYGKMIQKVAHTRLPNVGFRSWYRFLAVSLHVTWVINPAVGCHYFPPGPQLPSQPLTGLLPISLLGEQRHDGCEQFACVTRRRRGWDLNPSLLRLSLAR